VQTYQLSARPLHTLLPARAAALRHVLAASSDRKGRDPGAGTLRKLLAGGYCQLFPVTRAMGINFLRKKADIGTLRKLLGGSPVTEWLPQLHRSSTRCTRPGLIRTHMAKPPTASRAAAPWVKQRPTLQRAVRCKAGNCQPLWAKGKAR